MFFGIGQSRGKLYSEFKNLAPQKIIKELDVNRWDPKQIVFITYKLALYGGLHIQNTLRDKNTIRYANQDMIFVEGVAYTWANIHSMLSSEMRRVLYDEKLILQGVDVGGGVLAEMLSKHSGLSVDRDFYKPYQVDNSVEVFSERLLGVPKSKEKDPLKDQVLIAVVAQVFAATIQKGILGSVKSMVQMYLQSSDRKKMLPSRHSAGQKITSENLFKLCVGGAKRLHIKAAEFDPPFPKVDGILNDIADDVERNISLQCLLHSYALVTHCMLKSDRKFLETELNSEFGTSIMSNLVKLDMASFDFPGARPKEKSESISRQKQHMKQAMELAIHMLSSERFEGVSVLEAGVKLFCSKIHKSNPEHLRAIERLTKSIIADTESFIGQNA